MSNLQGRFPGETIDTPGGRYVWVTRFKSARIGGWVRRDALCCDNDQAVDNPATCASLPGAVASAEGGSIQRATGACAITCCDGSVTAIDAASQEECHDDALDGDPCGDGACSIASLNYQGTEFFTQPCRQCCALCSPIRWLTLLRVRPPIA
jgi:hypothetical protein